MIDCEESLHYHSPTPWKPQFPCVYTVEKLLFMAPSDLLPSLNALRAFEVASRHLNFRLASEELGVTQGAVAQHVRSLEATLGLRLFNRHSRTLELTDNGKRYCVSVRQAFALLVDATAALKPKDRHLTISVTPTFAAKWLLGRLPDFTSSHPDVDLRVLATDSMSHFQTEGVDLAVRYGTPPFGGGLTVELLLDDILVPVVSPILIGRDKSKTRGSKILRYPLLHDAHNLWPQLLQLYGSQALVSVSKNFRFNATALAIDAAIAGQGVALANIAFVEADISAGRLVRFFEARMQTEKAYYLVSPHNARHPDIVASVRRWLLRQAGRAMTDDE